MLKEFLLSAVLSTSTIFNQPVTSAPKQFIEQSNFQSAEILDFIKNHSVFSQDIHVFQPDTTEELFPGGVIRVVYAGNVDRKKENIVEIRNQIVQEFTQYRTILL
jgi:hypothetical protein